MQKQQARANYMKAHLAGKTEEAQADMARLALIRKQREEAAAKKAAEKAGEHLYSFFTSFFMFCDMNDPFLLL